MSFYLALNLAILAVICFLFILIQPILSLIGLLVVLVIILKMVDPEEKSPPESSDEDKGGS